VRQRRVRINELARGAANPGELTALLWVWRPSRFDHEADARQLRLEHVPMRTLAPAMRETWGYAPRGWMFRAAVI
jgi:hypothetical protein